MSNDQSAAEELLRETLRAKAADTSVDLSLDDIRRAARGRQDGRRRAAIVLLVAAAVATAVALPTGLLLHQDSSPGPVPEPTSTPTASPSSTAAPSPTVTDLTVIPRGPDPRTAYLVDGVVHLPDDTTTRLPPSASDVTAFTPYHGGWLVVGGPGGTLTQYDNTGAVVRSGEGERLAVSLDQTMTAFQIGDHIRVGIASGMGEGETDHTIDTNGRGLVGFLPGGVVYGSLAGSIHLLGDTGTDTLIEGLEEADATSWTGALVGGVTDGGTRGRVVAQETGQTLWTSDTWLPRTFSADGRYVAAVHAVGEVTDLAVLDSHTGRVVTRYSLADHRVALIGTPLWDGDTDTVLFCVADADGETVLRLELDGTVTRATDVRPVAEAPIWVFATTP